MLTDTQLRTLVEEPLVVVSGAAGTGKSEVVSLLAGGMEAAGLRPYVLRAAQTERLSAVLLVRKVLAGRGPRCLLIDDVTAMILSSDGRVDYEAERTIAQAIDATRAGEARLVLTGHIIPPLILASASAWGSRAVLSRLPPAQGRLVLGPGAGGSGVEPGVYRFSSAP